jgi:glutamate-1-semialdehyde 2,1-aminomutase
MNTTFTLTALAAATCLAAPAVYRRLQLSLAKHPSLTGHSRMAKRVARLLPGYAYGADTFFAVDGAPQAVAQQRQAALQAMGQRWRERHAKTLALSAQARSAISDMQFTGRYRVPFQFSAVLREHLAFGSFMDSAQGVSLSDLDGQTFIDLTGSYGVNVFGADFYRDSMAEAQRRAAPLAATLGQYHPAVAFNVKELRRISGKEEVSFHMSGTEAVMQAVRLARYHTGRKNLVRFCGAYHGWWEDVQPGPGNPMPPRETYTLKEMDDSTLRVLRTRRDIACVLVNPLQALHPNKAAPGDSSLIDGSRSAAYDREAYTRWLQQLREVCTARGIVLIFDEVFLGFRLAPGGAQEYFGVCADMVTYGKTLGGGLPVGVVCGPHELMKRYREDRPADICFARGTFNAHPMVMCAMQVFLEQLQAPEIQQLYKGQEERWNARAAQLNAMLEAAGAPVKVANMSSIFTTLYTQPSRYHWMLQFYLRDQGLALSWVGTGRYIFSLNFSDADFAEVARRFVAAAQAMQADGWWWQEPGLTPQAQRQRIRKQVVREMVGHLGARIAARWGLAKPMPLA